MKNFAIFSPEKIADFTMVKVEVKCRYCKQTKHVIKAGYSISGTHKQQRYQCNNCNKYFYLARIQLQYTCWELKER